MYGQEGGVSCLDTYASKVLMFDKREKMIEVYTKINKVMNAYKTLDTPMDGLKW